MNKIPLIKTFTNKEIDVLKWALKEMNMQNDAFAINVLVHEWEMGNPDGLPRMLIYDVMSVLLARKAGVKKPLGYLASLNLDEVY